MKKNDWLLAAGITGLALMILAFQILTGKTDHAQVVVSIDGNPYGTYDLNTDPVSYTHLPAAMSVRQSVS